MFRFIRPRTSLRARLLPVNILGSSRLPARLNAQAQAGQIENLQKVRLKKPAIRPRNIALSILVYYICYEIYSRVVFDPLDDAATDAVKHIPESELEEIDEKPLFIPFPGTTKQVKPRPYKGSDPEWQEFVKFSKNPELGKSRSKQTLTFADELAEFVLTAISRHPMLTMRFGKNMKIRRVWLDVDFPMGPPPEFERSGLAIGEDSISWVTMPVDASTVFKVRHVLWPSALMASSWSFMRVLAAEEVRNIAGLFGIEMQSPPPPLTINQVIARHEQVLKNRLPAKNGPQQPLGDNKKPIIEGAAPDKSNTAGGGSGIATPSSLPAFHSHFVHAMTAFKMKMREKYRPAPVVPPRGCIIVQGFVELDAPKAWIVCDVSAAWDPKTKTFDPRNVSLKLRRLQMKKQVPHG
ncbi:hypothetical protein CJF30_00001702 [Rutstroemia sp. NJR-2017a BBW]|nr:hypothetical protein CJF30_00001702 [Rutstroemia sp. NJR-2017a BBW]